MNHERRRNNPIMQATKIVIAVLLVFGLSPMLAPSQTAFADPARSAEVVNDLNGTITQGSRSLNEVQYDGNGDPVSNPTDLLVDDEGESKELISEGGNDFSLTQVDVTRYRQKVIVEYYYGDMNSSTLVGTDEGYADYLDYYSDYIKDIPGINATYGTSISADDYVLVAHPATPTSPSSTVKAYSGSDEPVVIKMLAGKKAKARYSVSATWYHNKQNTVDPSPFGLMQSEVNAATSDFWKIYSLSGSFRGDLVIGQRLDISSYFDPSKTMNYPSGQRTGNLAHVGEFTTAAGLTSLDDKVIVLTEDTPDTIYLGGFYNVEDATTLPVEAPTGVSSGMRSGAYITFTSEGKEWKAASTTETLQLADPADAAKLAAYSFDAKGDAFDDPEYIFTDNDWAWWTHGWMMGSRLTVTYTYAEVPKAQHTVTFIDWDGTVLDTQSVNSGDDAVLPTDPVREGYLFTGWDTDVTNVTQDLTVQAQYEADPTPVAPEPSDPTPQKPGAGADGGTVKAKSLPVTGDSTLMLAVVLGALASAGVAGVGLAMRRKHAQDR